MMKIITVVGTRPQYVKAAPVSKSLLQHANISESIVNTGQHYDHNLSGVFFQQLDIVIKHHLQIGSAMHGEQTGRMLIEIEKILLQEEPDFLLTYGDTNSTLAGALAASKLHIPIIHIEAGLRSFNRSMPEEINRVLVDHVSSILFAPTFVAKNNLLKEGIDAEKIHVVGDVMYDAALLFAEKADNETKILNELSLKDKSFILATIHRAENTNSVNRLRVIVEALCELSKRYTVVLPLHPRTQKYLKDYGLYEKVTTHLKVIEPVNFLEMIALEKHAALIATDSGGVQKEAYFYQTPCVTLRDETEWVELVETGWNKVVKPNDVANVVQALSHQIGAQGDLTENLYGDGKASERIASCLLEYCKMPVTT